MTGELDALAESVLLAGFTGPTLDAEWRDRLAEGLGGLTLFATNIGTPEQVRELTADIHAANPAAVIAIDEEGGDVTRLQWRSGSSYPGSLALGVVDDVGLTEQIGAAIGGDLARAGVDLNLAPSADVNCEQNNPVIGVRSFGAEPVLVGAHAEAWIRGHQARGVAACAKHFPGHGATTADSHHELPRLDISRELLERRELRPFRAAVDAGVRAVLTAHLIVPALDDVPATLSRAVLTDLLRGDLGFEGLVVSDAIDMAAIMGTVGMGAGAVRALAAGVDALCLGTDREGLAGVDRVRDAIVEALRNGTLPEARVREAADRMQTLARWAAGARHPATAADDALGLAAARRAIRVEGDVGLSAAPVVVELPGPVNMAAGEETPWGIGAALAERVPTAVVRRTAADHELSARQIEDVAIQARGKPLVVVVREVHRSPELTRSLQRLLATRPDAIVVETGFPGVRPVGGAGWICTFGAAPVCMRAAVEVLTAGLASSS